MKQENLEDLAAIGDIQTHSPATTGSPTPGPSTGVQVMRSSLSSTVKSKTTEPASESTLRRTVRPL